MAKGTALNGSYFIHKRNFDLLNFSKTFKIFHIFKEFNT